MNELKKGVVYRFKRSPFDFLFKAEERINKSKFRIMVVKNLNGHNLAINFDMNIDDFKEDIIRYRNLNGD